MLAITDAAAAAIKGVASSQGAPDGAGLRIATPAEGGLEVSLAAVPAEDDEVIDEGGAHVFLESRAAEALDEKLLDALVEGGRVRFTVSEQA
jgi:iron-sulfur cluster assembly protein